VSEQTVIYLCLHRSTHRTEGLMKDTHTHTAFSTVMIDRRVGVAVSGQRSGCFHHFISIHRVCVS